MAQPLPKAIRRVPTLVASLCFLGLLAGAMWLFMGRTLPWRRSDAILGLSPAFYSHVSNFSLSYLLYAAIGYAWLMLGVQRSYIVLLGLALALGNVVYELFLPILNTRDPVDAMYGLAGTAVAAAMLLLMDRFGMRPVPRD